MTIDEVDRMSGDELRQRIAGLLGWRKIEKESSPWNNVWELNGKRTVGLLNTAPPLYHSDLNAIYEAERTLLVTVELQERYISRLKQLSFCEWTKADGWAVFATCRQRAEALVLTLT
jgi:hypothetical protein